MGFIAIRAPQRRVSGSFVSDALVLTNHRWPLIADVFMSCPFISGGEMDRCVEDGKTVSKTKRQNYQRAVELECSTHLEVRALVPQSD